MTDLFHHRPGLFPKGALIAVVAVKPLPGSPGYQRNDNDIIEQAMDDIRHYKAAGVDGILLENSYDLPYIKPPLPEAAIELMNRVVRQARRRFDGLMGLQLLEAANEAALEIAAAGGLNFIRVEGYVFAHIGGAGFIEGCAGELQRMRKQLRAENIHIFADVKKKHCAHALTGDLSLADVVRQTAFFRADGVIVTGPHTGFPPRAEDLRESRSASSLPLMIGSGVTEENMMELVPMVDAVIVGSAFRQEGDFQRPLDVDRLNAFVKKYRSIANV